MVGNLRCRLRACGERPGDRRAQQSDEFAPSHNASAGSSIATVRRYTMPVLAPTLLDAAAHRFPVRLTPIDGDERLVPGMSINARLEQARQ